MSVTSLLQRTCTQIAVYWGAPQEDGYGGKTFDSPIEIKCRWEEWAQVLTDPTGEQQGSKADVFVLQDLDEEGYLYLGRLDDLDSDQVVDPIQLDGAWIIKQFEKIPALGSTTEFVRKVYLTWQKR